MHTVTLIPGDGIGPEISTAVMKIFEAAEVRTCQRKPNRHTQKKKTGKNVLTLFYFRLLFSGRREMLQPSKGLVGSGLFLLIAKNQWTGTKLVSKVNWLNAIIYSFCNHAI